MQIRHRWAIGIWTACGSDARVGGTKLIGACQGMSWLFCGAVAVYTECILWCTNGMGLAAANYKYGELHVALLKPGAYHALAAI